VTGGRQAQGAPHHPPGHCPSSAPAPNNRKLGGGRGTRRDFKVTLRRVAAARIPHHAIWARSQRKFSLPRPNLSCSRRLSTRNAACFSMNAVRISLKDRLQRRLKVLPARFFLRVLSSAYKPRRPRRVSVASRKPYRQRDHFLSQPAATRSAAEIRARGNSPPQAGAPRLESSRLGAPAAPPARKPIPSPSSFATRSLTTIFATLCRSKCLLRSR